MLPLPAPHQLPGGRVARERLRQDVLDAVFGRPPPRRIGRYRLIEVRGAGAMGIVHRAYDDELHRTVALKLIDDDARDTATPRIDRLLREAQAMARLAHPHVVPVYDVGLADDVPYIVMEYVEGPTLDAWLAERPRRASEILRVFVQAGQALAAAHAAGIVHRDFKPTNVLIDHRGDARITDFGLAHDHGAPDTSNGRVMGTPLYMAPEQHAGADVGPAADQFSFCVALLEALTGRYPFPHTDYAALVEAKRNSSLRAISMPRPLVAAIARGLAADPESRWPSMDALVAALDRRRTRRRVWLAAAGVSLLAVGGVVWPSSDATPCRRLLSSEPIASEMIASGNAMRLAADALEQADAQWHAAVAEVCDDTPPSRDDGRAADCLHEQRARIDAMRSALQADDDIDAALHVLDRVPQPTSCLQDGASTPPIQDDAIVRTLVTDLTRERARVRWADAVDLERASQLVERARVLGHHALLADALLHRARCEDSFGHTDRGIETAEEAYFVALRSDAARTAQSVALLLARLVARRRGPDAGAAWIEHARALLQRAPDARNEAELHYSTGQVEWERDRFVDAVALFERTIARLDELGSAPSRLRFDALAALAATQQDLGRFEAARETFGDLVEHETRVYGPEHVEVHAARGGLALTYLREGMQADTVATLERTASAFRERYGDSHPEVGRWTMHLAIALALAGQIEAGRDASAAAVETYASIDHPGLGIALLNLGAAELRLDRLDAARAALTRAIDVLDASGGTQAYLAIGLHNLANVYLRSGDLARADASFDRALAVNEKVLGEQHPEVASVLTHRSSLRVEQGRFADARRDLDRVREILESARLDTPVELAAIHRLTAAAWWREGSEADARRELDRARALVADVAGPDADEERERLDALERELPRKGKA